MKKRANHKRQLVKGRSSSFLISLAVHGVLLFFATSWVIFTLVKKEEAAFIPAVIERPKMELRKPRVKMKQAARPRKMQRISSKAVQQMPDVQLPDVSGAGSALSGGIGGFELMPDLSEMGLLGSKKSIAIGNDLEGTFYSLAMDRRGNLLKTSRDEVLETLRRFFDTGWNPRSFAKYYRMPQKLYATQIMIPPVNSTIGPQQFGMDETIPGVYWFIHYKGKIAHKEGGRFRFRGQGDDMLVVKIGDRIVFDGGYFGPSGMYQELSGFKSNSEENGKYLLGTTVMYDGNWFELEPGEPVEMEVLIGEIPGGIYSAMLLVEKEGEEHSKKEDGGPVLPIFKTAPIPDSVRRQIEYVMIRWEADLDDSLMFNVY